MTISVAISPASVEAVGVLLPSCAAVAVALRFHVRNSKSNPIGLDDWLIIISLTLVIALGATLVAGAAIGSLAQPTPTGDGPDGFLFVNSDSMITMNKIYFFYNLLQPLTFGTIKLSVLCFYRRIFRGQAFDITTKALLTIIGLWMIGYFFSALFQCKTDFWALWGMLAQYLDHCIKTTGLFESLAISDVILDIMILSIPIPMIWGLQLSLQRKILISGIFLMGGLSVAAGIVRMAIVIQWSTGFYDSANFIDKNTTVMIWGLIEQGVSIIAACLPTLKPLVSKSSVDSIVRSIRQALSSRSSSSSARSGDHPGNVASDEEEHDVPIAKFAQLPSRQSSHQSDFDGSLQNTSK